MGSAASPPRAHRWSECRMHGTRTANTRWTAQTSVCAVGARFDDRIRQDLSEFRAHAKFITLTSTRPRSRRTFRPFPIVGDAKRILARLLDEYRALERTRAGSTPGGRRSSSARGVPAALRRFRGQRDKAPVHDRGAPRGDGRRSDRRLRRRPASDVGRPQYYGFEKPRRWINSGGLGTMGFGLPAAMGAQVGCPEDLVCVISGDGSIPG